MPPQAEELAAGAAVVAPLATESAVVKHSTSAMVRAEELALQGLVTILAGETLKLVGALTDVRGKPQAQQEIQRSANRLQAAMRVEIRAARARGRMVAAAEFDRQMTAVDRLLQLFEIPTKREALIAQAFGDDAADDEAADASSRSTATSWLQQNLSELMRWDGTKQRLLEGPKKVKRELDPKLRRIAATEVAQAYQDEHAQELEQVAARAKTLPLAVLLHKRWEGVLDRRICPLCANHDNEVVRASEQFRHGHEPGMVHPNCRCQQVPAMYSTDLNLAHAVTRELAGPGRGRRALGGMGTKDVFADPERWPEATRKRWQQMFARAKRDADYRARLIRPEVRRHLESLESQVERHAAVVPRLSEQALMRLGRHTDDRDPRAIHEEYLGRRVATPFASFSRGDLVGSKMTTAEQWRRASR